MTSRMDEDALEKLAYEEILKDIKRGAERAQTYGAMGWQKNPSPSTNKTFLRNMLISTLQDRSRGPAQPLYRNVIKSGGRTVKGGVSHKSSSLHSERDMLTPSNGSAVVDSSKSSSAELKDSIPDNLHKDCDLQPQNLCKQRLSERGKPPKKPVDENTNSGKPLSQGNFFLKSDPCLELSLASRSVPRKNKSKFLKDEMKERDLHKRKKTDDDSYEKKKHLKKHKKSKKHKLKRSRSSSVGK